MVRICIETGCCPVLNYFETKINNWESLFNDVLLEEQYKISSKYSSNSLYMIKSLESTRNNTKKIIKIDNYSIFKHLYTSDRALGNDEKTHILHRILSMSGESVNSIVRKTSYNVLIDAPSLRFFIFFFRDLPDKLQDTFLKKCTLDIFQNLIKFDKFALFLYLEKVIGRKKLQVIFQQNCEKILDCFRCASKNMIDYCFEMSPSLLDDAAKLNKKTWFNELLSRPEPEKINQIFKYTNKYEPQDFFNDGVCDNLINLGKYDYEKLLFILNIMPMHHRHIVSYHSFSPVESALRNYQPKILELLFEVQFENIFVHMGQDILNYVCLMVKYFDQSYHRRPTIPMFRLSTKDRDVCRRLEAFNIAHIVSYDEIEDFKAEDIRELIKKCLKHNYILIASYMFMLSKHNTESSLSLLSDCILLTKKKDKKVLEFLKTCLDSIEKPERSSFLKYDIVKTLPKEIIDELNAKY